MNAGSQSLPRIAWSPREVAGMTGLSYDLVLDEIRAGRIPAQKFGTQWRIPNSYVQQLADPQAQSEEIAAPVPRRRRTPTS